MKIPASIPLLGHRITVSIIPTEEWKHGDDCVGIWDPNNHRIELLREYDGTKLEQAFFHELFHAALHMMNHKLAVNEVFVDTLSALIHQALSGATYPKKPRTKAVSP